MLFSEPKIPQPTRARRGTPSRWFQCSSASRKFLKKVSQSQAMCFARFSALQRAENSSNWNRDNTHPENNGFSALQRAENSSTDVVHRRALCPHVSVLFSEPKIPQVLVNLARKYGFEVSVLFSEPKIPQPPPNARYLVSWPVSVLFSEPKIPQFIQQCHNTAYNKVSVLFSEPKIPQGIRPLPVCTTSVFQCSSASRKFLKSGGLYGRRNGAQRFSALQRAENSSMLKKRETTTCSQPVSVLFSEPKIPQEVRADERYTLEDVSVLFSEPKIPQAGWDAQRTVRFVRFSALQRAENSSSLCSRLPTTFCQRFSALQRAENSSTSRRSKMCSSSSSVSVLFSEPKIPQPSAGVHRLSAPSFQCSSASRKFLNAGGAVRADRRGRFQCSSASRKFLNRFAPTSGTHSKMFQCSSASRKFLNQEPLCRAGRAARFQCSSASRKFLNFRRRKSTRSGCWVSVLFSEPKIPQSGARTARRAACMVSVLFSEPKIPQYSFYRTRGY